MLILFVLFIECTNNPGRPDCDCTDRNSVSLFLKLLGYIRAQMVHRESSALRLYSYLLCICFL